MKKIFILLLILILAVFLKFFRLGDTPSGVLVDGASLGYNAYSIMKTGSDEWGARFPLVLRSFGDYKPAGYAYLAIPFIKIFGLNMFSLRLPSAVLGLISILCLLAIVWLVTKNIYWALLSTFFLAISPWHVYISRMAFESNVSLGLFLLGLTFFLLGIKRGLKYFFGSALFLTFSIYVYVGYRILTPVLLVFIIFFFFKKRLLKIKHLLIFILFLFFLNIPLLPSILSKQANSRFAQVSIFNEQGVELLIDEQRNFCGFEKNNLLLKGCYLIWNKPTVISLNFLRNYFAAISPDFLFLSGDSFKFINNPNHGGMYIWLLPLFFLGLVKIIIQRAGFEYRFFFWWFLIAPLMSALAGPPNFIRSNMVFIPAAVICALGVFYAFAIFKNLKIRKIPAGHIFLTGVITISLISTSIMAVDYFFIYTKKAMAWDEYYPQVYSFLKKVDKDYRVIYFRNLNARPYIYMLFYQAIDPDFFREAVRRNNEDVVSVGKYQFVDFGFSKAFCRWQKDGNPKALLITNEDNLWPKPVAPQPLLTVKSFNGVHTLAVIYDIGETVDYLEREKINLPACLNQQND